MAPTENREQTGLDAEGAGQREGKGTPRPSTHYDGEVTRIGTKEDTREADKQEGEGTPEPGDNLRDGK